MKLIDFKPRPALVTRSTRIEQPRFPVIDAHNHLFGELADQPLSQFVEQLERCGVCGYVVLDGAWGEDIFNQRIDRFKAADPQHFRIFGGVDWRQWPERGNTFPDWAASRMRIQAQRGADGFKIWKDLGTGVVDQAGERVSVADRRLDPIWQTAAELNLPITFHLADPVAFFDPVDETNERWEELQGHPDWQFTAPLFPPFRKIVDDMAEVIARHPGVTFIGAHAGCYAENLAWVGALLDRCPNFNIDISARLGELGRQPYTARRFFIHYADRILFGLDETPEPARYQVYYRFFESSDEYFPYYTGDTPPQGRWMIYGIDLPDEILKKIYAENARRLFFAGD